MWPVMMPQGNDRTWLFSLSPSSSSPISEQSNPSSSDSRISPSVLFIIVIIALLFFISGLLHLLARFLTKRSSISSSLQSNRYPEISESDALQRQLQQLFHLHDSGLDQAIIDALPVFHFQEIEGFKGQFDCAVCLCEFCERDKLRLLPSCSHAFHVACIDTWLLSNSTCPLCRSPLDWDHPLEDDGASGIGKNVDSPTGVFSVRIGKFRKTNSKGSMVSEGETSSSNLDARRCYSMGSYEYVVHGDASLQMVGYLREVVDDSREYEDLERRKNNFKGDSLSVSKIWLWSKNRLVGSTSENPNSDLPCMERITVQGRV